MHLRAKEWVTGYPLDWDGMGQDGTGRGGMGWDGMEWDEMG